MIKAKDLTGNRYHNYVVTGFNRRVKLLTGNYYYYWNCLCDCGNEFIVETSTIRIGTKNSCGCMRSKASKRRTKRIRETLHPKEKVLQYKLDEYYILENKQIPLIKFLEIFSTEEKCLDVLFAIKYKDEKCPKCGSIAIETYSKIKTRRAYGCGKCGNQIYPTNGTIMQKSTIPIKTWFQVLYSFCWNVKNISSLQLKKDIQQCYKTAHRINMLKRYALYQNYSGKMKGTIEIDEAFLGKDGNKKYKWGTVFTTRKKPVLGFFERETGHVRVVLIESRNTKSLDDVLLKHIEVGSTVYTDGWSGYSNIKNYFNHEWVNHSLREYVRGDVTTNRVEQFWSYLKKNIIGGHVQVSGKYVENYIDEVVWKYNNRHLTSMQRFDDLLNRILIN